MQLPLSASALVLLGAGAVLLGVLILVVLAVRRRSSAPATTTAPRRSAAGRTADRRAAPTAEPTAAPTVASHVAARPAPSLADAPTVPAVDDRQHAAAAPQAVGHARDAVAAPSATGTARDAGEPSGIVPGSADRTAPAASAPRVEPAPLPAVREEPPARAAAAAAPRPVEVSATVEPPATPQPAREPATHHPEAGSGRTVAAAVAHAFAVRAAASRASGDGAAARGGTPDRGPAPESAVSGGTVPEHPVNEFSEPVPDGVADGDGHAAEPRVEAAWNSPLWGPTNDPGNAAADQEARTPALGAIDQPFSAVPEAAVPAEVDVRSGEPASAVEGLDGSSAAPWAPADAQGAEPAPVAPPAAGGDAGDGPTGPGVVGFGAAAVGAAGLGAAATAWAHPGASDADGRPAEPAASAPTEHTGPGDGVWYATGPTDAAAQPVEQPPVDEPAAPTGAESEDVRSEAPAPEAEGVAGPPTPPWGAAPAAETEQPAEQDEPAEQDAHAAQPPVDQGEDNAATGLGAAAVGVAGLGAAAAWGATRGGASGTDGTGHELAPPWAAGRTGRLADTGAEPDGNGRADAEAFGSAGEPWAVESHVAPTSDGVATADSVPAPRPAPRSVPDVRAAATPPSDVRDRLLAVLLDDPDRAVGAAMELEACLRELDRLSDAVRHERAALRDVLGRLAAVGLRPEQLARLAGMPQPEVEELLGAAAPQQV